MEKEKSNLHDLISELQDHFLASREAFVALTRALITQEALDVDLLRAELESARCHLGKNGASKAASVLGKMSADLFEDLSLTAAVLQGRKTREQARKRRQSLVDDDEPSPQQSMPAGNN